MAELRLASLLAFSFWFLCDQVRAATLTAGRAILCYCVSGEAAVSRHLVVLFE